MNKTHAGINIGSSSILMIFVILCLVSFAALSIVSAHADYKLSNKIADRTRNYYEACNQAEEHLRDLDTVLHEIYASVETSEDYYAQAGSEQSFIIQMSDLQSLQVMVSILYPTAKTDPYYSITSWQVITTGSLEYKDSLNVIQ